MARERDDRFARILAVSVGAFLQQESCPGAQPAEGPPPGEEVPGQPAMQVQPVAQGGPAQRSPPPPRVQEGRELAAAKTELGTTAKPVPPKPPQRVAPREPTPAKEPPPVERPSGEDASPGNPSEGSSSASLSPSASEEGGADLGALPPVAPPGGADQRRAVLKPGPDAPGQPPGEPRPKQPAPVVERAGPGDRVHPAAGAQGWWPPVQGYAPPQGPPGTWCLPGPAPAYPGWSQHYPAPVLPHGPGMPHHFVGYHAVSGPPPPRQPGPYWQHPQRRVRPRVQTSESEGGSGWAGEGRGRKARKARAKFRKWQRGRQARERGDDEDRERDHARSSSSED